MSLNINMLANAAVTNITNNTIVTWYKFKGINNLGLEIITEYEEPKTLSVMLQSGNRQRYVHEDGTPETKIFRSLWINNLAGGLDWAEERGQDYFLIEGIKYYVTQVYNYFNNQAPCIGWTKVTVAQAND